MVLGSGKAMMMAALMATVATEISATEEDFFVDKASALYLTDTETTLAMAEQEAEESAMMTRGLRPARKSKAQLEIEGICRGQQPKCEGNSQKFRTISGICNNLEKNKRWGARDAQYERLLPEAYADGKQMPRGGGFSRGSKVASKVSSCSIEEPNRALPPARLISTDYFLQKSRSESRISNLLMQIGQFLAHDIALTPRSRVRRQCCQNEGDANCFALKIPKGDKIFKGDCEHFVRSQKFCRKSPRQQMNGMTAFVDGSHIYGAHDSLSSLLRERKGGLMKVSSEGFELVPSVGTGDGRFRIVPTLLVLHTLFLREHNRVARELSELRADWDDEKLFQNARRIVIAEWQNIVYGAYLPRILGPELARKHGLNVDQDSKYDSDVNPGLTNGFVCGAMRFGHSQVSNGYLVLEPFTGRSIDAPFELKNSFFNSTLYESVGGRGFDRILRGLLEQQSERVDRFFSDDIKNSLFGFKNDLASTNIQRGRDHGVASYNAYRKLCGLAEICSFGAKPAEIREEDWRELAKIYAHPKDIDLYVGGISEQNLNNALVGPTFACLIANQFEKLKKGDRFFFTHANTKVNFDAAQLENLRKRSLAAIVCDNADMKSVREDVFDLEANDICCADKSIKLDLTLFAKK